MAIDEIQHRERESSEGVGVKAEEVVVQAKEQVLETVDEVKGKGLEQVRGQLDTQSRRLAERVAPFAGALRKAGRHLQAEGNPAGAKGAERAAGLVERLAGYLRDARSDRILGDVERFARRRPWAAGGIGATAGFVGARFLKASSGGVPSRPAGAGSNQQAPGGAGSTIESWASAESRGQ